MLRALRGSAAGLARAQTASSLLRHAPALRHGLLGAAAPAAVRAAHVAAKLDVEDGMVRAELPLPGGYGSVGVSVPATARARDLLAELHARHERLELAQLRTRDGARIASSSPVSAIVTRGVVVDFPGGSVLLQVPFDKATVKESMVTQLEAMSGGVVLRSQLEEVAKDAKMGPEELAAQLISAGVIDELEYGEDKVYVLSSVRGQTSTVLQTLDTEMLSRVKQWELVQEALRAREAGMTELHNTIESRVSNGILMRKIVLLGLQGGQIGFIAYLTFSLYSWDVIEPLSWFLMFSYFLSFNVYFLLNRKDPSYDTLYEKAIKAQRERLAQAIQYDPTKHAELKQIIETREDMLEVMRARVSAKM